MRKKTSLPLCLLGLTVWFLVAPPAYSQPAPERINAVYASIAGDHAALYVAQDMGLFRKHGLEVNLSYIAGAAQVIQTMMAGENQIATAGGSGVVDADFGGADLVAVAGMVNMPAFYIVVQPEIKSIQDLRGKAVGITRFGSSTISPCVTSCARPGSNPTRTCRCYKWAASRNWRRELKRGEFLPRP